MPPTHAPGAAVVPPGAGRHVAIRNFGATLKAVSADTEGSCTLIEHVLSPGYVAMPLHRHHRETETTYVLEGVLTVQVGARVHTAGPGTCIVKPRGVPHTCWNAGTRPACFLEVASPGGLEGFYEELEALVPPQGAPDKPNVPAILALGERYGLEFEMDSLVDIIERHGVWLA